MFIAEVTAGVETVISAPWSYSFSPAHAFAQHSRGQAHRCLILLVVRSCQGGGESG